MTRKKNLYPISTIKTSEMQQLRYTCAALAPAKLYLLFIIH